MKLIFLGAGGGIGVGTKNFQSNMILLSDNGKKLLIDCGTDIRFSLTHSRYLPKDLDAVYISHLHADHIGGLEWLAIQRKFASKSNLPTLIIHEQLAELLWNNSLSGGLKTLEDKEASLNDYFVVKAINDELKFDWEGVHFSLIKTVHIYSNKRLMPSYGLTLGYKGKMFFITTDTQFIPQAFESYYHDATLVFHDCETRRVPSGVHAHFNQLNTLNPTIKAKFWLYHYNDGALPDAQAHGFLGFVRCGQIIDLN
jgi:ribonuclease BN (tRNA processing enzyme)